MKYTKAMMEVVELEMEDVVLTSGCGTQTTPCSADQPCMLDGVDCRLMG